MIQIIFSTITRTEKHFKTFLMIWLGIAEATKAGSLLGMSYLLQDRWQRNFITKRGIHLFMHSTSNPMKLVRYSNEAHRRSSVLQKRTKIRCRAGSGFPDKTRTARSETIDFLIVTYHSLIQCSKSCEVLLFNSD